MSKPSIRNKHLQENWETFHSHHEANESLEEDNQNDHLVQD